MKSLATTSATLQSNPFARWIAVIIWISVALLCIGLSFVDLTNDYSQMQMPCEGAWTIDGGCNFLAISSAEAEVLASWGLTLQSYAIAMTLSTLIPILVYTALGSLILWQQKASLLGLTVSLALVVIPFIIISGGGEDWAAINPYLFLPGVFVSLIGNIIGICFLYLIPNGRFSPKWAYIPMAISVIVMSILTVHINGIITLADNLSSFLIIIAIGIVLLSGGLQVYRYFRVSNSIERQQTKWILFGTAIFFISIIVWVLLFGGAVIIPTGIPRLLASVLGSYFISFLLIVLPVAITLAILRYNLWNIDIAINRSLVGLIVTILLAIVFFASVILVQNVVNAENPLVGFAVSAIGPVLLFNPTRKRVRHFIDRRVYGFAFDLDELNAVQRQQHINPGALSGIRLGDYTALDVIGKGGMGEVYKGQGNGQTVAIKTMLPEIATDPAMRVRFMREAEIGQTLNHPGIAKVYTSGDYNGTPYLVMEYINGDDISQQLKRGEKYDTETATAIMTQVCEALDMAHSHGYIHRDIKPSNIMLRENGTAVLMDFGVTKVDDASVGLTGTGTVGTIAYMAPEQIKASKDVDYHADIYALGVMLYEMLTGQQPFTGGAAQILFAHLQQPPPDARDINPTIPANIADAIERAMSKKPEDRFQSAGEFAAAVN